MKPERLHFGDAVGIVAPASPPPQAGAIQRSVEVLEHLGFKPLLAPHARDRHGFLAGSDRDRAADLMKMFANRKVKALFCVRGGYGSGRLLARLDYQLIRANPKIIVGYSDLTALACALLTKARLVCFHGPMLNSDLIKDDLPDFSLQSLLRTLMRPAAPGGIRQGCDAAPPAVLRPGVASGPLVGGNLSVLCSLLGTPFRPPLRDRILFLEDLEEPPYRIDRLLTQLLNAGLLQQVVGIAIGRCRNCLDPKAASAGEYRQTIEDVFRDRLLPLKVPILIGLPFGHQPNNATLPLGVRATLDTCRADLLLTEPAVS
jgi:muramoyltetrapeptide carboxypeptidase